MLAHADSNPCKDRKRRQDNVTTRRSVFVMRPEYPRPKKTATMHRRGGKSQHVPRIPECRGHVFPSKPIKSSTRRSRSPAAWPDCDSFPACFGRGWSRRRLPGRRRCPSSRVPRFRGSSPGSRPRHCAFCDPRFGRRQGRVRRGGWRRRHQPRPR